MPMPMMHIRIVRMAMLHHAVNMHVTMWLRRVPLEPMLMLMMLIMHVPMPVFRRVMQMFMRMPLCQVQPHAHGHQRRRNPERHRHRLPECQQGNRPGNQPLAPAMNNASAADTLRVRLLSMPQHKQATATATGPSQSWLAPPASDQDSTTPPSTMAIIPNTMRRSAFSLNTRQAMTAVNTDSRLSISEAVVPAVRVRPNISATGPRMPPNAMAPISHGHSAGVSPVGFQPRSRM